MYQTYVPVPQHQQKLFLKPWFQVWIMFLAMLMCGPVLAIYRLVQRLPGCSQKVDPHKAVESSWKATLIISVPAACDLAATGLQNIALLFTNVSIWQMLRGSTPVFTALIRYFYLGKKTRTHELWGVGFVLLGLFIVGMSSFVSPTSSGSPLADDASWILKFLGIALVLLAQAVQAFQMVVEEQLLHDVEANALYIVCMEGFWGLLFCTAFVMPSAQWIPGRDGFGVHEDIWPDEYFSITHSKALQWITIVFALVITLYNITGMWITEVTEATTRNVMDAGRTLCVWLFTLTMSFVMPQYGEKLGLFSLIEAAGFLVLMIGVFVYYKTINLPWIRKGSPNDLRTPFMSPQLAPGAYQSPGPQPNSSPAAARTEHRLKKPVFADVGPAEQDGNVEMMLDGDLGS